jgi:hypothetical protein
MSLMSLLGYADAKETVLTRPGEVSSAKVALADSPKGKIGRGMDAGRIVAKVRGERVVVSLFTPKNRSWYGPLFEGILQGHQRGFGVLRGRFRFTYPQMVSTTLFQLGVVLFSVEGLVTGGYRSFGLNGFTASLVAALGVLAVALLPRLGWGTLAWKRAAVIEYLGSCGFLVEDRERERST